MRSVLALRLGRAARDFLTVWGKIFGISLNIQFWCKKNVKEIVSKWNTCSDAGFVQGSQDVKPSTALKRIAKVD